MSDYGEPWIQGHQVAGDEEVGPYPWDDPTTEIYPHDPSVDWIARADTPEQAARIVACVNACAGIDDLRVVAAAPALLAACQAVLEWLDRYADAILGGDAEIDGILRAAIRAAEGML